MFSPTNESSSEPNLGENNINSYNKTILNHHGPVNNKSFNNHLIVNNGGSLTPDIKSSNNPLLFLENNQKLTSVNINKIGKYIISEKPDNAVLLGSSASFQCRALEFETGCEFICKVTPMSQYRKFLEPYWVVGSHENINNIHEIIQTESLSYIFFKKSSEDLHSYIRRRCKLKEDEVCWLFTQIVSAVKHCHDNGVILRDLKLRKFVFQDSNCTHLLLDSLEDSCILADQNNDLLTDRHGCPAYVSPEILFSVGGYSGKLADVWSLGVIFYTLLAGKYPFHDSDVGALFKKIRQGVYPTPVGATNKSKCLLRNLLRVDSSERMGIDEIFAHPWFQGRNFQKFEKGSTTRRCAFSESSSNADYNADNMFGVYNPGINLSSYSLSNNSNYNNGSSSSIVGINSSDIHINNYTNNNNININYATNNNNTINSNWNNANYSQQIPPNDDVTNSSNRPVFSMHVDSLAGRLEKSLFSLNDHSLSKLDQVVPVFDKKDK